MKKSSSTHFYVTCLLLAAAVLLSACGKEAATPDVPEADTDVVSESLPKPEKEAVSEPEREEPESGEDGDGTLRELTPEEVAFFDEYLTSPGNWGFLLTTFNSPEKIDLNTVFYGGAGISGGELTQEQAEDFLSAADFPEIYTDVLHLTTPEINDFLMEKTGLTLSDMENKLEWVYSEKTDTWYSQAGDTNWRPFACTDGLESGDVYILHVKAMDADPGYRSEVYEVILEKNGDGYRFVSNLLMTEEGKIQDQSFDVVLDDMGEVTFASYVPDADGDPHADVTFRIIQDGMLYMTLRGVTFDNIREDRYFLSVDAVSFLDIDGDGYLDLITIASYGATPDTNPADGFREARIYTGNEWAYLSYEEEMTEAANSALAEISVESVLGFLGVDR